MVELRILSDGVRGFCKEIDFLRAFFRHAKDIPYMQSILVLSKLKIL